MRIHIPESSLDKFRHTRESSAPYGAGPEREPVHPRGAESVASGVVELLPSRREQAHTQAAGLLDQASTEVSDLEAVEASAQPGSGSCLVWGVQKNSPERVGLAAALGRVRGCPR